MFENYTFSEKVLAVFFTNLHYYQINIGATENGVTFIHYFVTSCTRSMFLFCQ